MLTSVHYWITMTMTEKLNWWLKYCKHLLNAVIFLKWWTALGKVLEKVKKCNKKILEISMVVALVENCFILKQCKIKTFKFMWKQRFCVKIIINTFLSYRIILWEDEKSCRSWENSFYCWIVEVGWMSSIPSLPKW